MPLVFRREMTTTTTPAGQRQFPCKQCGAGLVFAPGTTTLTCPYCGAINQIPARRDVVREEDFRTTLATLAREAPTQEVLAVKCNVCGAETTLSPNVTADRCPFCGSAIVATAKRGNKGQRMSV